MLNIYTRVPALCIAGHCTPCTGLALCIDTSLDILPPATHKIYLRNATVTHNCNMLK